jgi:hypothetical protein
MGNFKKTMIRLSAVAVVLWWMGTVSGNAQETYVTTPPPQLNLPAGSWISVVVNQPLSSDQNRPGDLFLASLAQPLVVNGFVVARRGQTLEGRIVVAERAGRRTGTSRLGLELTEISLVDGTQLPVVTEWVEHVGPASAGEDAVTIATTTGLGAVIGAAADGGFGAGMGAIAGAAASTIGVLATRGKPTVVYPESMLTFRTLSPLTIDTVNAEAAFQPVQQEDYEPAALQSRSAPRSGPGYRYYDARYKGRYPRYSHYYSDYSYGYPYLYYEPYPRYLYGPTIYGPTVVIRPAPRFYRPRVFRPLVVSPRIVIGGGRSRGDSWRGRGGDSRLGGSLRGRGGDFRGGNSVIGGGRSRGDSRRGRGGDSRGGNSRGRGRGR